MLMKCERIVAAVGCFLPESKTEISREGLTGMWQSMQFCTMAAPAFSSILQKLPRSLLWQLMQRSENKASWPRWFLCGS
jgi:hypothetical protein